MARRRGKDDPSASSNAVVTGFIRSPDDREGLEVTIRLDESRITMATSEDEIGTWPAGAVSISQIDGDTFAFVAEGDRLLFHPTDSAAFAGHPAVVSLKSGGRRKRKPPKTVPTPTQPPPPTASASPASTSTSSKPAAPKSKRLKRSKKPSEPKPPRSSRLPSVRRSKPSEAQPTVEKKDGWRIRLVDLARGYSIFSLDRVPVDTSLRGKPHEHTWDHVAARSSGPSHHICTVCGKFRLRASG